MFMEMGIGLGIAGASAISLFGIRRLGRCRFGARDEGMTEVGRQPVTSAKDAEASEGENHAPGFFGNTMANPAIEFSQDTDEQQTRKIKVEPEDDHVVDENGGDEKEESPPRNSFNCDACGAILFVSALESNEQIAYPRKNNHFISKRRQERRGRVPVRRSARLARRQKTSGRPEGVTGKMDVDLNLLNQVTEPRLITSKGTADNVDINEKFMAEG